ncbi:sarcosine oxidase [Brevibacterium sanguinis]|uniref:Sarcosine oxidase n=2 Tax=Brevibacterium TaxID=1696 RepID=A0A366IEC0_9MICO|nr:MULTISPECIES: FAD-dependent oxidoreductase [Brevibacterium]RBP62952.1 sarcosine oxidase [Brevibacterium sanguinis]RBP69503.1 sarcosine oxidase [Brevibacterium celere]
MNTPRIAVVGTGTIGSQVLWQLARQGVDAVGYELYSPGHPRGAAGGESRLFRYIELEDMRYFPVVQRANQLWNELQEWSQVRLRYLDGALTIAEEGSNASLTALKSVELLSDRAVVLSRDEMRRQHPYFRLHENEYGILDKDAGTIYPDRAIQAASSAAIAQGASLRTESRVTDIIQRGSQVLVRTDRGDDLFDRVVVAAGAWTSTLMPEMAPLLAPRRLLSTWYLPRPGTSLSGVKPYIRADPNYSYGLPTADGSSMKLGLGFANHKVIESPDSADSRVVEADLTAVRELVEDLLPQLESYPMRINSYFESYTRSRVEYVGWLPSMDNVVVMAGFSGKGFKTSPAIGELGSQLVLEQDLSEEFKFIVEQNHRPFGQQEPQDQT